MTFAYSSFINGVLKFDYIKQLITFTLQIYRHLQSLKKKAFNTKNYLTRFYSIVDVSQLISGRILPTDDTWVNFINV